MSEASDGFIIRVSVLYGKDGEEVATDLPASMFEGKPVFDKARLLYAMFHKLMDAIEADCG